MFTKAIKGKGLSVIYIDGRRRLVKSGGSRSWRNNNPGNIKKGAHSRIHSSIGSVGGFAVFPTYEDGVRSLRWLLKKAEYQAMTVFQMVDSYAPMEDSNDPAQYRKLLRQKTGLNIDRKISSLDAKELEKLVQAIMEIEGVRTGTEEVFEAKSILDVEVDKKNRIVAYLIDSMGWKSKAEVIELVETGRVDAVIVEEGNSVYIRTRPDGEIPNNLEEKKPRKK